VQHLTNQVEKSVLREVEKGVKKEGCSLTGSRNFDEQTGLESLNSALHSVGNQAEGMETINIGLPTGNRKGGCKK